MRRQTCQSLKLQCSGSVNPARHARVTQNKALSSCSSSKTYRISCSNSFHKPYSPLSCCSSLDRKETKTNQALTQRGTDHFDADAFFLSTRRRLYSSDCIVSNDSKLFIIICDVTGRGIGMRLF